MMTFKQLEAIYWVTQLGGFSQAAQKLHTSQSAVSKRVQELETVFKTELFDRSQRSARLTEKGEEMFVLAKNLLQQRDSAAEQFSSFAVIERRFRIGITEVTAMTWLPRLVELIQIHYPKVTIEPDVDASGSLRDKLLADELDLVFVPDVFADPRFSTNVVGQVESSWMCRPGLVKPGKVFRLHELATHRLLIQGSKSGVGLIYDKWMRALGVQPTNTIVMNNVLALMGLAVSGLGISYFPTVFLSPMLAADALMVIPCTPALPTVDYVAMYKRDRPSTLTSSVVLLAQECCDFTRMFQTSGESSK